MWLWASGVGRLPGSREGREARACRAGAPGLCVPTLGGPCAVPGLQRSSHCKPVLSQDKKHRDGWSPRGRNSAVLPAERLPVVWPAGPCCLPGCGQLSPRPSTPCCLLRCWPQPVPVWHTLFCCSGAFLSLMPTQWKQILPSPTPPALVTAWSTLFLLIPLGLCLLQGQPSRQRPSPMDLGSDTQGTLAWGPGMMHPAAVWSHLEARGTRQHGWWPGTMP